ncbi:MAG: sigma-70 family RNA polymerase sigma factor [Bacteroidales bacterium]|nr:sigma-70 family RNA polymerase sigma factor [Bacteroidales bacterium]
MTELPDDVLLRLFQEGEDKDRVFSQIVRKYQEKIYFLVRRIVIIHEDTDDVVQNIFIKIWNNLDNFREDSKLFTWIYRISVNESLSFLKSRKYQALLNFQSLESEMINSLADDRFFSGEEIEKKLQEAIIRLPARQRMVFNMRYYDELSYEEMAGILDLSVGALKASYHFAVKKITAEITGN